MRIAIAALASTLVACGIAYAASKSGDGIGFKHAVPTTDNGVALYDGTAGSLKNNAQLTYNPATHTLNNSGAALTVCSSGGLFDVNLGQTADGSGQVMFIDNPDGGYLRIKENGSNTDAPEYEAITAAGTTVAHNFSVQSAMSSGSLLTIDNNSTPLFTVGFDGNVTLANPGTAASLRLNEPSASGSNYSGFKAQAQSGDVTYTLPAADGTSGYALTTNGTGTLSWAAAGVSDHGALTGLADDDHTQYLIDPGAVTDEAIVRWDTTSGRVVQDSTCSISDIGTAVFKDAVGGNTFLTVAENGTSGVLMTSAAANDGTVGFKYNTSVLKGNGNLIEIANGGIVGFAGTWDGVLTGGNVNSNHFVISSNTPSSAGITDTSAGRIKLRERVRLESNFTTSANFDDAFFSYEGIITSANAVTSFAGYNWAPTFRFSVGQVTSNAPALRARPIFQHTAGVTDAFTAYLGLWSQPTLDPNFSSGTLNVGTITGVESGPRTNLTVGAATISNMIAYGAFTLGPATNILRGNHTITNLTHYYIGQPSKDAGITIGTQYGMQIPSLTHGTVFNIGVSSAVTSGGGNFFLYSSGTADSVHTGDLRIGDTTQATQKLEVLGHVLVDNSGTASELRLREPSASGSNYTALKTAAQAGNVTYTLPTADGSSGQILSTNGSGTLSWATDTGSGSPPTGEADLTCDNASFTSAGETTLLTLPDFDNTGKTTNLAFSSSVTCVGGARNQTFRLKAEGSTVATFQASCASADPQTVSLVWQDTTSASARTWILTAQSNAAGTQTVQQCSATRITF